MTKTIEPQFPILDHKEHIANIRMVTDNDSEFEIPIAENIMQTLCIINIGETTALRYDNKCIEIPNGVSTIKLEDITNENRVVKFKLDNSSSCEYFVIGRFGKKCTSNCTSDHTSNVQVSEE